MSLSLLEQRDPAWLDLQYNNRARVADSVDILARWAAEAAVARAEMSAAGHARLDLAYGPGPSDRIDVFTPRGPASEDEAEHSDGAPVLVFIHGGWWRALSKDDFSHVAPAYTRAGALVMLPEYALCPAVTIDQICLQTTQALAWAWRNAAKFGGDPSRIVVVGHSAGAHLAAMLLCCDWRSVGKDLPANLVRSALAISGLYDLAPVQHTPFVQVDLNLTDEAVARLSPARFGAPKGRLMATVGGDESESFLAQNDAIRAAWGQRTVPVCEAITGTNHFTVVDDFITPGGRQFGLAWELLDGTSR
ncbi:MAG: alpha/beta hydrolase [Burkholderiales bacterium]|nr:alpha/beta hydrolase [Burkholderiales bacterium]